MNHSESVRNSTNKLIDKVADKLVDRTLKVPSFRFTDVASTTLGKPGRVEFPGATQSKPVAPYAPKSLPSLHAIPSRQHSIPSFRWQEQRHNDKVLRSHKKVVDREVRSGGREVRAQGSPSGDFDFVVPSAEEAIPSTRQWQQQPLDRGQGRIAIARLEKFARLPIWPLWNGVALFVASKIFGQENAAKLEAMIGGRVCPNFYQAQVTNPFLLLVHHVHSFFQFDPLRYIQKVVFPEGFPAHPHRGFITITYCLSGGMVHRDSMGNKQVYGAEKSHGGQHTQWLVAGSGMLHEEMWDVSSGCKQELFQLWLNLPSEFKMVSPQIQLLGDGDKSMPIVQSEDGNSRIVVLAGQYGNERSAMKLYSDVSILHVSVKAGGRWTHSLPGTHRTGVLYMRKGSGKVEAKEISTHTTAYLSSAGNELVVEASKGDGADFLLLTGEPIKEPISMQGSMVMNSDMEIAKAYEDYERGNMGIPWSQAYSDEQWKKHIARFPNKYAQEDSVITR